MNHLPKICCCIILVISLQIQAQHKILPFLTEKEFSIDSFPRPLSVFMTNPFAPLMGQIPITGEYRLLYQTAISHNMSVIMGVSYLGKSLLIYTVDLLDSTQRNFFINDATVKGIRGQAGYRFFICEDGLIRRRQYPQGLYIGPHVSYSAAKYSVQSLNFANIFTKLNYFNINLMGGLQYQLFKKFLLDVHTGIGFRYNVIYANQIIYQYVLKDAIFLWDEHPVFKYYKISFGFNIGYFFN